MFLAQVNNLRRVGDNHDSDPGKSQNLGRIHHAVARNLFSPNGSSLTFAPRSNTVWPPRCREDPPADMASRGLPLALPLSPVCRVPFTRRKLAGSATRANSTIVPSRPTSIVLGDLLRYSHSAPCVTAL